MLDSERDIGVMARTSRRLYDASINHLYEQNMRRSKGSALFWAAQQGRTDTLRKAHAVGIKISRMDVMEEAAKHGHVDVFRVLYSVDGEAITQPPADGEGDPSPLSLAAEHGHVDLVEYLCNIGFDVEYGSCTPLTRAAGRGQLETVRCLLRHGADTTGGGGKPPLLHAIYSYNGDLEVAKVLLENGADANYTTSWGNPLLHHAVSENNCKLVELLVDHGADTSTTDANGQIPLELAIVRFKNQAAVALLDKGADDSTPSSFGMTPLLLAVDVENTELAKVLLARGVDLLAREPRTGRTALHLAAHRDYAEMARLLLEHGISAKTTDTSGLTPIQVALGNNAVEVFRVLLEVADVDAPVTPTGRSLLHEASKANKHGIVQVLLARPDIDIDRRDAFGRTALFHAARHGHALVIKELLSKGASATAKDQYESTPTFAAVRNGLEDATAALLEAAPDVFRQRDGFGHTLLWWAEMNGNARVKDLLLQHAADVGASMDVEDSAPHVSQVDFDAGACYCDVCTRCVESFGNFESAWQCPLCYEGNFIICIGCALTGGMACPGGESHATKWVEHDGCRYKESVRGLSAL